MIRKTVFRIGALAVLLFLSAYCILPFSSVVAETGEPSYISQDSVKPDTWAAVDGLGRTVSNYSIAGDLRERKTVGCFYWLWLTIYGNYEPRNITQIINDNPDARNDYDHPAWEGASVFRWDEPLLGFYSYFDKYVLRKHAELLADAGVDVIIFDCTNGDYVFKESYDVLFEVFEQAISDGVNVPKVAFMLNFGEKKQITTQLRSLYKDIYMKGRYQDLWFYWDGKPLIMSNADHLGANSFEEEIKEFFTFRRNEPTYFCADFSAGTGATDTERSWGWCSVYPQTKYGVRQDGSVEQICVSVAQNACDGQLVAMNHYKGGVQGRGYANGDYSYSYTYKNKKITVDKNTEDAYLYGLNFQQQWDYALSVDPDFVFVTGWNESVCVRLEEWCGSPNAFSDNYTAEFSRDIEPSAGVLKDYYYYQLVDNIRKYKGVSKPEIASADTNANKTVDIHSENDQWADVTLSFNHYSGSTQDRDYDGAKGTHYVNHTMRNDIISSKVAYDADSIYFMVETAGNLTDPTDPAWMRLLIDTDPTGVSDNWEGFEYIINRLSPEDAGAVLERSTGGWNFEKIGNVDYNISGNRLQIAVSRSLLGLKDDTALCFNFKWADNTREDGSGDDSGDILDFYKYGDVAPGGRFMFSFATDGRLLSLTPEGNENPGNGSRTMTWIIAGSALAIIAIGTAIAIIIAKKRRIKVLKSQGTGIIK